MPIRVILADDHAVVRQGIRFLLEHEGIQVIAEAGDGWEAIQLAVKHSPDIVVIDISMPSLNGLDAARELKRAAPKTKPLFLTLHEEPEYLMQALRAGAKGYVLKNQAASDLIRAIHLVHRGEMYLSPGMSTAVVHAYLSKSEIPADPITSRERQVLQLIAEGKSTRDIASLLGISAKTADSHRSRLMGKLDIHEVATLVRYAVRKGLVQP